MMALGEKTFISFAVDIPKCKFIGHASECRPCCGFERAREAKLMANNVGLKYCGIKVLFISVWSSDCV